MEVVVSPMPMPVVPKASPDALPELATYLAPFAPLFRRSTSRASVERYLTGLLTDLERKNCDTIAAAVAGTSTECLQYLLTDAAWDPQALDQQRMTALVAQSPPHGLLLLDDTGLPKQGRSSVGVARQYSGRSCRIQQGVPTPWSQCQHTVSDDTMPSLSRHPRSTPGEGQRGGPRQRPRAHRHRSRTETRR
jgi:hypothetical protein